MSLPPRDFETSPYRPILESLDRGFRHLDLPIDTARRGMLLKHILLLAHWNKRMNLTRIDSLEQMALLHTVDSAAALPILREQPRFAPGCRAADLGSGNGFPGIVLAVAAPEVEVILIESAARKCSFLLNVKAALGLKNLEVVCCDYNAPAAKLTGPFDTVICRAGPKIGDLARFGPGLIVDGGSLVAFTGNLADAKCHLRNLPDHANWSVFPNPANPILERKTSFTVFRKET